MVTILPNEYIYRFQGHVTLAHLPHRAGNPILSFRITPRAMHGLAAQSATTAVSGRM